MAAKKKWGKKKDEGPNGHLVVAFDGDYINVSCAAAGESRAIRVTHISSGRSMEFKTRTEFWGRSKKKLGGWLEERNSEREAKGLELFCKEDFEVEDIQKPDPIENVLHSVKSMVDTELKAIGTDKFEMYISKTGEPSFRENIATLMPYKGQRQETIKPVHLNAVYEYMVEKFDAIVADGVETDDLVIMRAFGDENCVVAAIDKDTFSQPVLSHNPNRPDDGIINGNCLGKLWIEGEGTNKKFKGYGRLHLLFQMISGDKADNYKFNAASDVKWGDKSAFDALVDCKTDQEAWDAVLEVAKKVYPEPKLFKTVQGNTVMVDGWYVLNEMFNLARMKTHVNDFTTLQQWLDSLGVEGKYE